METTITMTSKEQRRAWVLTRVLKRELTMTEAAGLVGLSERQLWRLRSAFERDGPAGLVHANRGRPSERQLDGSLRARVIDLRRTTYVDVNDAHLAELLAEREGIEISRPSLQRVLRATGLASPRRRRAPRHHSRRERMPAEGLLLQLDGSRHDWLEERGPRLTLAGAIDDATGRVPAATFRDQEDAAAYLEILAIRRPSAGPSLTARYARSCSSGDPRPGYRPRSPARECANRFRDGGMNMARATDEAKRANEDGAVSRGQRSGRSGRAPSGEGQRPVPRGQAVSPRSASHSR